MDTKNIQSVWLNSFREARETLDRVMNDPAFIERCASVTQMMVDTIKNGGHIFSCGNGGSYCDSMHFAEELTGRYRKDRKPLGAVALGDAPHLTCVANDYGYDVVFSRHLQALARPGDMLLAITTSGNSPNIIKAVEVAREMKVRSVGLLGKSGGKLRELVDIALVVPSEVTDRIQEVHIKLIHTAIETLERQLFPENY